MTGILAVGSSAVLGVMVGILLVPFSRSKSSSELLAAAGLYSLGWIQSVRNLAGTSSHAPMSPLALPSFPWMQRRLRKKSPAWSDGDTVAISRLECNHPESGGDASKPQPSPHAHQAPAAGSPATCERCECKIQSQLKSMQSSLQAITGIGWTILLFLVWREVNPTTSLWWTLPLLTLQGRLLAIALPICERHLECLLGIACDERMTPNDQKLSHGGETPARSQNL